MHACSMTGREGKGHRPPATGQGDWRFEASKSEGLKGEDHGRMARGGGED